MLPKEQRAALLTNPMYLELSNRGMIQLVVASQNCLSSFLAYSYDKGYIMSAIENLKQVLHYLESKNENPEV